MKEVLPLIENRICTTQTKKEMDAHTRRMSKRDGMYYTAIFVKESVWYITNQFDPRVDVWLET
jgi:hypothetical protein